VTALVPSGWPKASSSHRMFSIRNAIFYERLFRSLRLSSALWPQAGYSDVLVDISVPERQPSPKVLVVVAHPDDESECAATLYRVTHELGGTVDQVVVTDGASGHQYSTPAQYYYNLPGSHSFRKNLSRLRRRELKRAGRVLGIRRFYFLGQRDTGFTLRADEGFGAWDTPQISKTLSRILMRESYDVVLLLLPSAETHGHHKTVAILALEAVAAVEAQVRPAVLGIQAVSSELGGAPGFSGLEKYSVTRTVQAEPVWSFNRTLPMRCHSALDYSVVVNWTIAEHKTQGMFQMEFGRRTKELYWLFEVSGSHGTVRWNSLARRLSKFASCSR
jgi:N-acetylglucosamine malate deacetylase 2